MTEEPEPDREGGWLESLLDAEALPDVEGAGVEELPAPLRRARTYWAGLLLVAILVGYWYTLGFVWHRVIDDAGISFAYAKHLVEGWGLVAVPGGQNVEAYSNFLWVVLLAVPGGLGISIPTASKWIGAALGLVAVLGAVRLVQRLEGRNWDEVRLADGVAPCLLVVAPGFVTWMPSGLENALYACLLVVLVLFELREREQPGRFPWSGFVAVGLALTRPEGLAYGGILGAFKAFDALREPERRPQFLRFMAALLGPLAVYHLWHYLYFERLVPNTFYAKEPGRGWQQLAQGWSYLENRLYKEGWVYFAPLAALSAAYFWRRVGLTCAVLAFNVVFILAAGGDWMKRGRFVSYALPLYAALVQAGVSQFAAIWAAGDGGGRSRAGRTAISVGALVAIAVWWGGPRHSALESIEESDWCQFCEVRERAEALESTATELGRPVTTVLTHDFGGFAWESTRRFHPIDFLGLADLTMARAKKYRQRDTPLQKRHAYQYVFHEWGEAPGLLFFPDSWWGRLRKSPEFQWSYHALDRSRVDAGLGGGKLLAMHRSTWVEMFPPVRSLQATRRVGRLRLLDAYHRGPVEPGERVEVHFTLVPTADGPVDSSFRWTIRVGDGRDGVEREAKRLFEEYGAFRRDWRAGEPVAERASVEVPEVAGEGDRLELGLRVGGEWNWVAIRRARGEPEVGAAMVRFPRNLPVATDGRLADLRREVARLAARRRDEADTTLREPQLARRCAELGRRLESSGRPDDAYLAYLLGFRADRRRAASLAPKIWELRPIETNAHFTEQYVLLRRLYRTGRAAWGLRLAEWYAHRGFELAGRYVAERLPPPSGDEVDLDGYQSRLEAVRRRLEGGLEGAAGGATAPPFETVPGVDGGFEADDWSGWSRSGNAFTERPHEVELDRREPIRGHRGSKLATSYERNGDGATGRLVSEEFRLDAPAMMFLVGGGDGDVGVELVVDGRVVRSAKGDRSVALKPVVWDLRSLRGRRAKLRIVDRATGGWGHVIADGFRLIR